MEGSRPPDMKPRDNHRDILPNNTAHNDVIQNDVTEGAFFHNLVLFSRILHGLGMQVSAGQVIELHAAFAHVPIGFRDDFYHTLSSLLVKRKEDQPLFDQAFDLFWRKPPDYSEEFNPGDFYDPHAEESPDEQLIIPPQPETEEDSPPEDEQDEGDDEKDDEPELVELTKLYSAREQLRQKDFADLTAPERDVIQRMMVELVWTLGQRRTRRYTPARVGILDMRRSLRQNLRYGGEPLERTFRAPKIKPRPLVVLADISGSMEQYARTLLQFLFILRQGLQQRVDVFVFGTRLTSISRQLRHKEIDHALDAVASEVHDWSGGTRIGDSLRSFNYDWSRRVLRGGPVVLLISDGWDRGDPALLGEELARLRRLCYRLIWLNPLLGSEQYEPLTQGMQAALPHIDDFLPVHNLASLEELAQHLSRLEVRPNLRARPLRTTGAAFIDGA